MQYITKLKLAAIHQLCDAEDKSTEYMLQFMQDTCNVNLDTVINYMNLHAVEQNKLWKDLKSLTKVMVLIENYQSLKL